MFASAYSVLALMLLDISVLGGSMLATVVGRYLLGAQLQFDVYLSLAWLPLLYLCIAVSLGIYSKNMQNPVIEIKDLSQSISIFYFIICLLSFLSHDVVLYSRSVLIVSWGISLLALPLARAKARRLWPRILTRQTPCVIIGRARDVRNMLWHLSKGPSCFKIVAVCVAPEERAVKFSAPVSDFLELDLIAKANPGCQAMLLASPFQHWPPKDAPEKLSFHFRHVLLGSPETYQLSLWTCGIDVLGRTLLTCQFKLLDPWRMRLKRAFDICFCLAGGLLFVPFLLIIAALIKLDSRGPVLYTQTRRGQDGKVFNIIKFRTMHCDADKRLNELLQSDPLLAKQWEDNQKIDNDPRITKVGSWLRRTSLDELPQLLNVLTGDMSLVGPRPIVDEEIERYGESYAVYCRVKPGLTGLWQVSGRNEVSYEQRVIFDVSYVRNWSIYLDLWILACTFREVYRQTGR